MNRMDQVVRGEKMNGVTCDTADPLSRIGRGAKTRYFLLGKIGYRRFYVTCECKSEEKGPALSFVGNVPNRQKSDVEACGQVYADILDIIETKFIYDIGWNKAKVERLVAIWKRWHMNDFRAGCEHQRAERWHERPIDVNRPIDTYGFHFKGQRHPSWNMLVWVTRNEHPEGLLLRPCPTCGYEYGSEWLYEPIPAEILAEIETFPTVDVADVPDVAR